MDKKMDDGKVKYSGESGICLFVGLIEVELLNLV